MSSALRDAIVAVEKVQQKRKNKKKKAPKRTQPAAKPAKAVQRPKSAPKPQNQRYESAKVKVIHQLTLKSLAAEDGKKMMAAAVRNAFHRRIPPMEHTRVPTEPLTSITNSTYTPNASGSCLMFIPNLSVKFQMGYLYSAAFDQAFVLGTGVDPDNQTEIKDNYAQMRTALCACEAVVATTSDVLRPRIFVGQAPNAAFTPAGTTPKAILNQCRFEEITRGNYAYVCNVPDATGAPAMALDTSKLITGPPSNGFSFIMVTHLGTDATKVRVDVKTILQGEGTLKPAASKIGIMEAGSVDSTHATWNLDEIYDNVTDFVWKAKDVVDSMPPGLKNMAAGFAWEYLGKAPVRSALRYRDRSAFVVDEEVKTITVTWLRLGLVTYTYSEALNIVAPENKEALNVLRDNVSDSDYKAFIAFATQPPPLFCKLCNRSISAGTVCDQCRQSLIEMKDHECPGCYVTTPGPGLCSSCDVTLKQFQATESNNGVTSVDSTPEPARRQLDALRYQLTGKVPPVKDLNKFGIAPKTAQGIIQQ